MLPWQKGQNLNEFVKFKTTLHCLGQISLQTCRWDCYRMEQYTLNIYDYMQGFACTMPLYTVLSVICTCTCTTCTKHYNKVKSQRNTVSYQRVGSEEKLLLSLLTFSTWNAELISSLNDIVMTCDLLYINYWSPALTLARHNYLL